MGAGGSCERMKGLGIGGEVCGDDWGCFSFGWTGSRTERTRICAEQRSAVENLTYGGESHASLEEVRGPAV